MGPRAPEIALQLANIRVEFADQTVLMIGELTVYAGKRLGIIGPNGAGKSTLLRIAALLQQPDRGSVQVLGSPVWPPRPVLELRRQIAVVFQNPLLLDMTVDENVAVGLRVRGLPADDVAKRVRFWLQQFGIWQLRERGIHGLSGGEAQRVSLARAFAVEPELMLMDEPFANLDLPTRQQLLREVANILQQTGTTILLVSHDFYEVARLCDEALALFDGTVIEKGQPQDLLQEQADPRVKAFLSPWKELSSWSGAGTAIVDPPGQTTGDAYSRQ